MNENDTNKGQNTDEYRQQPEGGQTPTGQDVRYYSFNDSRQQSRANYNQGGFAFNNGQPGEYQKKSNKKPILIFIGILIGVVLLGVGCTSLMGPLDENDYSNISGDYIGVLYIEGTISGEDSSDYLSGSGYNHQWTLNAIDDAIENTDNKGLIIFVNSPGGGVYESDEIYLKLKEYKKTGRPLYSAMGSMAASGGYYISAPADKIIANRNCWTGSIGVTIGTLYDVSGLLQKHGIKTATITSGKNKAMGDMTAPLSPEQRRIFQSLVDESYDQFVDIVAQGRDMPDNKVRKLADGRIYTAKQAKANGLIDAIGTLESAEEDMKAKYNLEDCEVVDLEYVPETTFWDSLLVQFAGMKKSAGGDVAALLEMMNKQGEFPISYMSDIQK